jgi:hypothetical protein
MAAAEAMMLELHRRRRAACPETSDQKKYAETRKGFGVFLFLAEWTGLEPATPGVTGRYSNQLNYHSMWDEFRAFLNARKSHQTWPSCDGIAN